MDSSPIGGRPSRGESARAERESADVPRPTLLVRKVMEDYHWGSVLLGPVRGSQAESNRGTLAGGLGFLPVGLIPTERNALLHTLTLSGS